MKKLFRKIHLWLALPFGLIMSITCLSGAILVFEKEVNALLGAEERLPFFRFMFRLHRWLLDVPARDGSIEWGKLIVGVSTLLFVVVLISGIVIWWPRTKQALKNSLKIHTGKGLRRFWHDLHVAGGMYVLVFLLVMSLTGLTWSFSWYAKPFYAMFGADVPVRGGRPGAQTELVRQNSKTDNSKTITIDEARAQHSREVRRAIKAFHTGTWGGIPVKILYFIAALIGSTLPLTGYYLWYRKRLSSSISPGSESCRQEPCRPPFSPQA